MEGQLAKHALASAPDLEARLSLWDRKQVIASPLPAVMSWAGASVLTTGCQQLHEGKAAHVSL